MDAQRTHPLRAFRERQNPVLSLDGLGRRIGVSKATISRWEAGLRRPNPTLLPKITEITGIPGAALRPDLAEVLG